MPMAAAVRAMRRAISPRLAMRRDVMGVIVEEEVLLGEAAWVAAGAKNRGAGPREGTRSRREVRLMERILVGLRITGPKNGGSMARWDRREVEKRKEEGA